MPKIDIDKIAIDTATGYPPPFNKAVEGRCAQAARDEPPASRSSASTYARSSRAPRRRSGTGTKTKTNSSTCSKAKLVLCEDGGETVLKPGDAAGWKAGVANGHCLVNRSDRDAVFVEVGTRAASERAHYSDIDMMVVRDGKVARYTKKNGEPYSS